VDDFGTGYSSMSYLRRFPIDKLKIDRGFIAELMTRADDASIVRAIISLAHSLRLKVVAEGVETLEQLDFLKAMGCDQYQGYHFSRPLPAAEFGELVLRRKQAMPLTEQEAMRTHSKLAAYKRG
jgi:EAL domain-containing protein (putative c-di-GMP-specific phosphodiesterase class I)